MSRRHAGQRHQRLWSVQLGPTSSVSSYHRMMTSFHLADLRILQGRLEEAAVLLRPWHERADAFCPRARLHLAAAQQQRENTEALTAESAAQTLRGDETHGDQGGDEDLDREEAAIAAAGKAAEHRGRESEAGGDAERARDDKVTAQFTPTPTTTTTTATKVARRPATRTNPPVPVPTQTRTRGRGR